jgi:hypothetical protein
VKTKVVKQDVLCYNTLDFKMWLKDLLCGYNALNHLEIVLWTPVLESDQVKYKGCKRSNAKKENIPLIKPRIRG